jgi:branched-subunit amino acid transport protein
MSASELLLIVGMAAAVYAPKVLPLALVSERDATRLRSWLQYVAPAVLGALVAPSILAPNGELTVPGWQLLAYALAAVVAATTRSLVAPLFVGGLALLLAALLSPQ